MKNIQGSELRENNGGNGRPAWVAANGTVYDISGSSLWPDGMHMNTHKAGSDLTESLGAAPHGPEVLERFTAVGRLADTAPVQGGKPTEPPPSWLASLLALHPHPISVHFPIALFISAAAITILAWITGTEWLHHAALLNYGLACLATPVAILTGTISHTYNYAGSWTAVFRIKRILSYLLVVTAAGVVLLHLGHSNPVLITAARAGILCTAPLTAAIGYFGGKITFPR